MEKFLKEILSMNSKNRLSSHLIILIYTLNNIDLNSKNIGYKEFEELNKAHEAALSSRES
ncbi:MULTISPECIES: hypothetical protein [Borreliella]|uniref:Uncharacterized protein n=1 Tax=Borreliella burgdorferi (strain ATCC 35210 / DSM 4680 / CIP 102532 / B31) TaxID=224326 RepID=O51016_BORBU|nr:MULTISPECIES: hypothetical protein [Borreliella]AAC66367.1 conserved hypothetical protein [Borreliella burgdorferi B31]MCD2379142.1 hypothetical protein [Borreliella burgdorferi]MCR8876467.1 hypothetical protein [Borreliella burgdorferi]MCR8876476.1 hypothetical protein [Borreliella burgdorferi]PNL81700.1 hypothetical protein A6J35_006710 [Borreliella burgdorferi]